jgi:iron complex transport system substrate-binding protein
MTKLPASSWALISLALVCAGSAALGVSGTGGPAAADERSTSVVSRDALGTVLPAGPPPQRIVSLSPNLTEILFAVGVKRERIVGVTRFCDYPAGVEGIARVGGIVDPSIEAILSLQPDLVLATRGNPTVILDRLRAANISTYAVESQGGIAEIYEAMRSVVRIASPDDTARASAALHSFSSGLACLRTISAGIVAADRPRVYYHDPASPDWTAGPGTHVNEAIELAGGKNIGGDAPVAWPRLSAEVLLVRRPEVILVASQGGDTGEAARGRVLTQLRNLPGLRSTPAVRDGRICMVPADWLLRPGPRVIEAIQMLGRCLHPDEKWGCGR